MTKAEAIEQAQAILRDEANELLTIPASVCALMSHRAKCAVSREVSRIKEIADTIGEGGRLGGTK